MANIYDIWKFRLTESRAPEWKLRSLQWKERKGPRPESLRLGLPNKKIVSSFELPIRMSESPTRNKTSPPIF